MQTLKKRPKFFATLGNAAQNGGFALVVTLSMMTLLTLLAVGLLSLSTKSLSVSNREASLNEARTNARLALDLAIGQLQLATGPDQRITMTGDQVSDSSDGTTSSAAEGRSHWTGVYRSWLDTEEERPNPEFITWLVSGTDQELDDPNMVTSTGSGAEIIELVGQGTVGSSQEERVYAPILNVEKKQGDPARVAWWIGDQGTKAALSTPTAEPDTSIAAVRASTQSADRSAVELAAVGNIKPFESLDPLDTRLAAATDWKQASFLASDKAVQQELFHDLAAKSSGMITNVRAGGFRKDLSMQLELDPRDQQRMDPLYEVGGESGINFYELWAYYNLYNELTPRGRDKFTTGGTMSRDAPYLELERDPDRCQDDYWHFFKQPVIISYQIVLSFEARPIVVGGSQKFELRVVADPIITLWNPLDVPVLIPQGSFMSVKYWQIPYTLELSVNGQRLPGTDNRDFPLSASLQGTVKGKTEDGDGNYLTLNFGKQEQLVFKPGEIIKVSQSGDKIYKDGGAGDRHNLVGLTGFNFGGGVSLPVKDFGGNTVELNQDDVISYRAFPNNLTAGKTAKDGNTLIQAETRHSRHFSLTHHEVYIGADRDETGKSLGVGNMAIDWDFGDQRLKPRDKLRRKDDAGTKLSNERLYADKFPEIFKTIEGNSETRTLPVGQLISSKAPFVLISYNAKTENGSELGTKYLSRFNPKAHHVDFYDLSQEERDMLPYEFSIDPLTSWKGTNKLEVSDNGNAYYGGGLDARDGTSFLTTHSVPREPIVSMGSLQHSFANGFEFMQPVKEYATLNAREPLLPQISHAIGNSLAPSVIPADQTQKQIAGGRYLADHSYLANLALWDDWAFSGIAPQREKTFAKSRPQTDVAEDFFNFEGTLPTTRYRPDLDGRSADELVSEMFSGRTPSSEAIEEIFSYIRVDGAFNVNSTSVEAWKAVLGGLKGQPIITREILGDEKVTQANDDIVPVSNLHAPMDEVASGSGQVDVTDPAQWIGRRTLTEEEIEQLAEAIVSEVRKRGPFLSLGDFVNRRLGTDDDLAKSGAVQSALDSSIAGTNAAYSGSTRAVSSATANRFEFPDAEEGSLAYGIPGVVKQADILTPIAPFITVRSDSFIIRAYGESVDASGKVKASAWCEAVVERNRRFVDPEDEPGTPILDLKSETNKTLGRAYEVKSFRWLHPSEV